MRSSNVTDRTNVGLILILAFTVTLLAGGVHELGHAFFAKILGGTVTGIQPFWLMGPPHIHYTGSFSHWQRALISAGGLLFSVGTGTALLVLVPFRRLSKDWIVAFAAAAGTFIFQTLGFFLVPIAFTLGANVEDDSVTVAQHLQVHPLVVSVGGLVFFVACGWLLLRRTQLPALLKGSYPMETQVARPRLLVLVPFVALIGIFGIALTMSQPELAGSQTRFTMGKLLRPYTVGTVTVPDENEQSHTLSLQYQIEAKNADLHLVVVGPDGETGWEQSWSGQDLTTESAEEIALFTPGSWRIELVGSADELKCTASWHLQRR